jgi:hypothetical protein
MLHTAARWTARLLVRDDGQDLIEYALLTGIVAVLGALLFPSILEKMGAAYQSWLTGSQAIWEPPPPSGT